MKVPKVINLCCLRQTPKRVEHLTKIVRIEVGQDCVYCISEMGCVVMWGRYYGIYLLRSAFPEIEFFVEVLGAYGQYLWSCSH